MFLVLKIWNNKSIFGFEFMVIVFFFYILKKLYKLRLEKRLDFYI